MKIVCENRKARHDYHIEETLEAGLVLLGTEVKALREGRANLRDSYVRIKNSEAYLVGCHISPYSHGNIQNHEPLRDRKLLLHRHQIERLRGRLTLRGYTLVPLRLYFKGPYAKIEIGLAKGKRLIDKRQALKEKEARRMLQRLRGSRE
jgi:SsrA-binding protein